MVKKWKKIDMKYSQLLFLHNFNECKRWKYYITEDDQKMLNKFLFQGWYNNKYDQKWLRNFREQYTTLSEIRSDLRINTKTWL